MRSMSWVMVAFGCGPVVGPAAPPPVDGVGLGWPDDVPVMPGATGNSTAGAANDALTVEATVAASPEEVVGWYAAHLTARWEPSLPEPGARVWRTDDLDALRLEVSPIGAETRFRLTFSLPEPPRAGELRAHGTLPDGWPDGAQLSGLYRVGAARIWSGGARVEVAGPPAADAAFAAALGWELTPDGELTDGAGRTLLIDRTEPRGLRAVLTLTTKGSAPLSCAELEGR